MTEKEKEMIKIIADELKFIRESVTKQNEVINQQSTLLMKQSKELSTLKAFVKTQLNPTKLQEIGVRAVREATFSGENMENFVRSMKKNFEGATHARNYIIDLIKKEAQDTRNSIPSGASRGGMYS